MYYMFHMAKTHLAKTCLLSFLLLFAVDVAAKPSPNKLTIVATTAMIAEPLSQIVGGKSDVITLIKSGIDPHSYRPKAHSHLIFSGAF